MRAAAAARRALVLARSSATGPAEGLHGSDVRCRPVSRLLFSTSGRIPVTCPAGSVQPSVAGRIVIRQRVSGPGHVALPPGVLWRKLDDPPAGGVGADCAVCVWALTHRQ